jgi:AcrR family transcriptional regulator
MSPAERRTATERREEILAASMQLFARHGFHGVTTRMIADACGISEALLYRHWKGKDELYAELQRSCMRSTVTAAERLAQMEPSTSMLVLATYFMVRQILPSDEKDENRNTCIKRLMLGSLVDDGTFARGFLQENFGRFVPKLVECLEAAQRAGDLEGRVRHAGVRVWFAHNVTVMVSNMLLPTVPAVDYGVDRKTLIDEVTGFGLRGLGLTEAALARHFVPKALAQALEQLLAEDTQPAPTERGEENAHAHHDKTAAGRHTARQRRPNR